MLSRVLYIIHRSGAWRRQDVLPSGQFRTFFISSFRNDHRYQSVITSCKSTFAQATSIEPIQALQAPSHSFGGQKPLLRYPKTPSRETCLGNLLQERAEQQFVRTRSFLVIDLEGLVQEGLTLWTCILWCSGLRA